MSKTLYDTELAAHSEELFQSLTADNDEYLFALIAENGEIAMILIDSSGATYTNEDARAKLKEVWKTAYVSNLDRLLRGFAEDLDAGIVAISGVKTVLPA